jgi:hypothetical protein
VRVQTLAVARLVAATARADGRDPDQWQVMEALQRWAVRLPHGERLRRLRDLGERTDDLWLGSLLHQAGAW